MNNDYQEKKEHEYFCTLEEVGEDFNKEINKIKNKISKEYLNNFLVMIAESWINDDKIGLEFFEKEHWGWKQYIYINYFVMNNNNYEKEVIELYRREL